MPLILGVIFTVFQTPAQGQSGQVLRVCESACGWGTVFTNLHDAIDEAQPGDEIWVAAGTYLPTDGCDAIHPLECSFELPAGVTLYGNFCGDEQGVDVAVRDPLNSQCITTLDGQFGIDPEDGRVLHVVRADTAGQHYIDGFTITRGWARGWSRVEEESGLPILPPAKGSSGGGMLVCSTASVV